MLQQKSLAIDNRHHNYTPIPSIAEICDRYNVSNTVGAAIATVTLVDFVLITDDNNYKVIDRTKLLARKGKNRQECAAKSTIKSPSVVFFMAEKMVQ